MPPAPDVSVLIVTYDHGDEIGHCLDATLAQAADDRFVEILVADNASRDDTAGPDRGMRGRRRAAAADGRQPGFAGAVNAAFAAATGEHMLILNPDCVMDAG